MESKQKRTYSTEKDTGKLGTTYADAGVDIKLGDDVSKILYNAAKVTWENRKGKFGEIKVSFNDFRGARFIDVAGLPEGSVMYNGYDGVTITTD